MGETLSGVAGLGLGLDISAFPALCLMFVLHCL